MDRPVENSGCPRSRSRPSCELYNVVLIPVATGVLYPFTGILLDPILAAAAMALSSLTVVSNALRLRRFTPPRVAGQQASMDPASVPNPA